MGMPVGLKISFVNASALCLLTILAFLTGSVSAKAQGLVFTSQIFPATTYNSSSIIAADVNGDGKLDLIIGEFETFSQGNNLTIFTNNGSGIFGSNATLSIPNQPTKVVAADIDGSGKPALISSCSSSSVIVFTNNGSGAYGSNAIYSLDEWPISITAADLY